MKYEIDWPACLAGAKLAVVILIFVWVLYLLVSAASDLNTQLKAGGLKSVVEEIWCGQKGCAAKETP